MALADNIRNGKAAVEYVKSLGIKASNKVGDRIEAAGGVENVIAGGGYDDTAEQGVGQTRTIEMRAMTIGNLRGMAEYTERTGFGNCGEQAVIAILSLYERGVRPLDLMSFDNRAGGYDHAWVVIGLDPDWERDNLRSWGDEAVWCDPWQGEGVVFAVDDLVRGKVRNLSAIYKCNTAELVQLGNPRSVFRAD